MSADIALVNDTLLALPEDKKLELKTKEDCRSFLTQLKSVSQSVSWLEADTYLYISENFDDVTVQEVAADFKMSPKTVYNYIRTARAFPPEKRSHGVSFSHHLEAAFKDSYDENTGEFKDDTRFGWIEKAEDENFSARRLREEIVQEKERAEKGVDILPCNKCARTEGEILRIVMYVFGRKKEPHRFNMHRECLDRVLLFCEQID